MIELMQRLDAPGVTGFALQAPGGSWYPGRFTDPLDVNQPELDWALDRLDQQVRELAARGWARDRIALVGYSQGACLVSEYAYRNPGRWACVFAFTGGLIGPPGTRWGPAGDFRGTPVLLTNGDDDPWVPWSRVEETARCFEASNAEVDARLFPGRPHTILDEEVAAARAILDRALDRAKVDA